MTMPAMISLDEAQARLSEIVTHLHQGEEVVILQNEQPVARLIGERPTMQAPRQPGLLKHMIAHMADDFDAPLEDFKEYTE
jgi:antitoxin (DNA-binding transcriptional repressor) of toxin-antitoxin stability system